MMLKNTTKKKEEKRGKKERKENSVKNHPFHLWMVENINSNTDVHSKDSPVISLSTTVMIDLDEF